MLQRRARSLVRAIDICHRAAHHQTFGTVTRSTRSHSPHPQASACARSSSSRSVTRRRGSWHNLGYVLCRIGRTADAWAAYQAASDVLERVMAQPDSAAKARREKGFVYSHQACAHAKHGQYDAALSLAATYFDDVAATGLHREPMLAYLGAALAMTGAGCGRPRLHELRVSSIARRSTPRHRHQPTEPPPTNLHRQLRRAGQADPP